MNPRQCFCDNPEMEPHDTDGNDLPPEHSMNLNEYQDRARTTAIYRRECARLNIPNFVYSGLGLAGEAGEVSNKLKKIIRDDGGELTSERRGALLAELGGVLWYVAMVADDLGLPLDEVAGANLAALASRAERGTVSGSGDVR